MPPDISTPIARSWATGQIWPAGEGPALTATDLANILGADPWGANPSYTVSIAAGSNPPTTTDGRFTIVNGTGSTQAFLYQQAPPGGQPSTQSYQEQNTSSSTFGTGGKYTIQQAWGLEERFSGSFFWQSVQYDFKQSQTLTWTTQRNNTTTDTSTETNMLSITGPTCTGNPCTPLYTGPSQFDVYQDNLYGTFMFWGVN